MCDDLNATLADLQRKGAHRACPVADQSWGIVTEIEPPGGARLGIYQPRHPKALNLPH